MQGNRGAMKRLLPMFAILLPSLVMGQDNSTPILDGLRGATFRLTSARVGDQQIPLPAQPAVTIRIEEAGKVSGHSIINLYVGSLSVESDGTVTWGSAGFALTRRSGPPMMMDLESLYLQALESTTRLSSDGATLTFSSEEPPVALVFERLAAGPQSAADLYGKSLSLTSIVIEGQNHPLPSKPRISITLNSNGTCSGFSGVNRFFGRFSLAADGAVAAGPFASTMMAGPAELMELEAMFHKALGSVTRMEASGGTVRLLDSTGATVLSFQAR
jgi:heat shock protein HslJ